MYIKSYLIEALQTCFKPDNTKSMRPALAQTIDEFSHQIRQASECLWLVHASFRSPFCFGSLAHWPSTSVAPKLGIPCWNQGLF